MDGVYGGIFLYNIGVMTLINKRAQIFVTLSYPDKKNMVTQVLQGEVCNEDLEGQVWILKCLREPGWLLADMKLFPHEPSYSTSLGLDRF